MNLTKKLVLMIGLCGAFGIQAASGGLQSLLHTDYNSNVVHFGALIERNTMPQIKDTVFKW